MQCEEFKAVLVLINPSPQSSPQGEEEKILIGHTARSFTKLNFAFSSPPHPSPLLKERENAVGLASDSKERK
mgnify:CR=1 FL=1